MIATLTAITLMALVATSRVEYTALTSETIDGVPMSNPQGLAVNLRTEEFLVADALNDRILIFDTTGALVFDFTLGDDRHNPLGIAVNAAEEIIVGAMDRSELWVYDYSGEYLNTIDLPLGVLPGRLLIDSTGAILVINRAGHEVLRLDAGGAVVAKYESPEEICKPSGICFDNRGDLFLVSTAGAAVTAFDLSGKKYFSLGVHGSKPENFSHPTSAAVDDAGELWVVDSFRHELKHFDSNHKFMGVVGGRGTSAGDFFFPIDIKITPGGKMGVLEKGSGRLQIFRIGYGN